MHWGRGCTSTRPVPVPMLVWAAVLVGAEREKKGETAARDGGCECSGGLSQIDVPGRARCRAASSICAVRCAVGA